MFYLYLLLKESYEFIIKKKYTNIWGNIPRALKHSLCFLDYFCDINLANICFYFICRKVGGYADSCSRSIKVLIMSAIIVSFFFIPEKYCLFHLVLLNNPPLPFPLKTLVSE